MKRKTVVKKRKAGLSTKTCSLTTLNKMSQFKTPGLYLPWYTLNTVPLSSVLK